MKKFAIIAAIVAGFLGVTAAAEAGYYTQRCVGYDHCGRPVYRTVYVETCAPRYYGGGYGGYYGGGGVSFYYNSGGSYCAPRHYHSHYRSYGHGHSHRYHCR